MGQHMTRVGPRHARTASGYVSENVRYRAQRCEGCPLRCLCYKARGDRRTIEVNHRLRRYKEKASELLTSEEGLRHRGRRCIEPEAVFGQIKHGMAYKRFRHFGKDMVTMDFAFFAIAFNIKKMCSKIAKQAKNGGNKPHSGPFLLILRILPSENRIFWQNRQKSVAKKISKPQSAKKRVHRKNSNYDTLSNLFNPDGRWACHHKHTLVTFEPYLRI